MARQSIKLSKTLVKGIAFSILTMLVVTVAALVIMIVTPHTVYNKILSYLILNRFNSEVYYTEYYRRLSLFANEEDWMIVTPMVYLCGGFVYGWFVAPKRRRSYILATSALTSVVFSFAVLAMCNYSSTLLAIQGSEMGVHMPTVPYNTAAFEMGVIQTAYWALAFVVGSFAASLIKSPQVRPTQTLQTTSS